MTSRSVRRLLDGAALCCLAAIIIAAGCQSEPPPRPIVEAAPPPPPPPPVPKVTPIDQLMIQLGIDERVELAEADAPNTDEARKAVLEFFDAFARGDATTLGSMLSVPDRQELDELIASGVWTQTTSKISRIRVQTGASPAGEDCALAIFYVGDGFQPQLWYYMVDIDGPRFDAVAATPGITDQLSGSDWISAWFDILGEELALADKPDEDFIGPQRDVSEKDSSGGPAMGPSGPSNPTQPTLPPGGPRKRPKPRTPRRPPGPP